MNDSDCSNGDGPSGTSGPHRDQAGKDWFGSAMMAPGPAACFVLDRDGRFAEASPACAQVFGLDGAEALHGRPFLDFIHACDHEAARRVFERMLGGETVNGVPVRTLKAAGDCAYVALAGSARLRDGAVVGVEAFLADVSSLAQLTDHVRRQAEHYQALTESSEDLISRHAANGDVLYVSPSCERLLGYTPDELVGTSVFDYIHPDDRPLIAESLRALRRDGVFRVEYRSVLRDGSCRWFETSGRLVADGPAEDSELVAVARDITERRRIEEALRESESRYRMLYENVPLGISTVSLEDYRILTANPALCAMIGYDEASLCRLTVQDITPPEDFVVDAEVARRRLAGEAGPNARDKRVRRSDGAIIWVRGVSVMLPNVQGEPPRVLAIMQDITEIRAQENALRDREARYRALYENSPLGIVLVDHESLAILEVNAAFCALVGYTEQELRGRGIIEVTHVDDVHVTRNALRRPRGAPGQLCYETRYVHRDGRIVWTRVTWDLIHDGEDTPAQGIAVVADITRERERDQERRQLEARMQQAQKLESLGMLAGGIAHDFNNLLMAVLGNVELISQDLPVDAPIRPLLDEITFGAKRAAELSHQMLAYSGRGTYELGEVDLNAQVASLRGVFDATFPARTHVLLELGRDLPSLRGDRAALSQLVLVLVTNAAEALRDGHGRIEVRTYAREFDEQALQCPYLYEHFPPGRYLALEVDDDGRGMDASARSRLFDPFFSTKFTGRGLGLAAALGIIRSHHGLVQVESEPDNGTMVRVLFPVRGAEPRETQTESPATARGNGVVLLAEDDDLVRRVTHRLLERRGFTVVDARDGVEAVEAVQGERQRFDCALLDLSMPRMNGEEAARRIRELRPDLPIILSSGYPENEVHLRFADGGFDAFLEKPYASEQVLHLIQQVLAKSGDP